MLLIEHAFATRSDLIARVVTHYRQQLLAQLYTVLFSAGVCV
jgi:hypothetical protein